MKTGHLLTAIFTGVWAIHPESAQAYLPLIGNIMTGKAEKPKSESLPILTSYVGGISGAASNDRVGIIEMKAPVVKYDTWCESGTESISKLINEMAADSSVKAIIIDIDSPGGEAGAVPILLQSILKAKEKKPVIAYSGNGLTASAAYWIAAACTEIYATFDTDMIGSIGTYLTIADVKAYYESQGLKLHEIYASKSKDKNGVFRQALEGNYEPIIKEYIDPVNNQFIADVKSGRPNVKEEVFSGKVYFAKDALSLGLIDGILSFEEVVDRSIELSKDSKNFNTPNSMFGSKFKALEAFGKKATAERTAEDIQAVNEELKANGIDMVLVGSADHAALVADAGKVADLTSKVSALEATEKTSKEKITNLEKEVGDLKAIVPPTTVSKKDGEDEVEEKKDAFPLTEADEKVAAERKRLNIGK